MILLLLLAAAPLEAARTQLSKELEPELARKSLQILAGGRSELVLRLTGDVFERMDPLWKSLYAFDQASRRHPAVTFRSSWCRTRRPASAFNAAS